MYGKQYQKKINIYISYNKHCIDNILFLKP